jgi:hypothetical protein
MAENNFKHFLLKAQGDVGRFTNPQGGGGEFSVYPGLDPKSHGNKLLSDIKQAISENSNRFNSKELNESSGLTLTFESWDGFQLKFESLEDKKSKIELLFVQKKGDKYFATVRIPDGKLSVFFKKIDEYMDGSKLTKTGKSKNLELLANIEGIKLSVLENFWSDSQAFPTDSDREYFLEAWLRVEKDNSEVIRQFREEARKENIFVSERGIQFPENTVYLIRGSLNQLKRSVLILDCLAELKIFKDTPATFLEMSPLEEKEWADDLKDRISLGKNQNEIAICILDTGVNYSHPILVDSISVNEADTYDISWGKSDHHGHGTEMAGLALFGDLYPLLISKDPIVLNHRLESVKILPTNGNNPKHLYGEITEECVARAELMGIDKKRFFNMAVTSKDFEIREGEPSSWSASIDKLSFGNIEALEPKRLFFISVGNLDWEEIKEYPDSNALHPVENPAQAWNCISVGAFTEKTDIDKSLYPELNPIAGKGKLTHEGYRRSCNGTKLLSNCSAM